MQSWNTRWIIPSLRSSSARVSPPWCPAGLVSAPPSDLWDTCLLIFIYSFIYSAQILARHTHTHTKSRGKRLQGWDSAFARRRGAARNLSGFRAFMGPLLGQLEDIVYFVSMMIQIVEFLVMFLFFFLFLALVNEIFKQFWCYIDSSSWISSGDKNSFPFQSNFHEEFLYKRWIFDF